MASHLQVVDQDAGDAAAAVDIQHQQVDVGLASVQVRSPLGSEGADLPFQPQRGLVDGERLPERSLAIRIAMQQRRQRAARLRVASSWQNDPRHQLDAGRIGLYPHRGRPLGDDRRRVDRVGDMDRAALPVAYLQVLAALARACA